MVVVGLWLCGGKTFSVKYKYDMTSSYIPFIQRRTLEGFTNEFNDAIAQHRFGDSPAYNVVGEKVSYSRVG